MKMDVPEVIRRVREEVARRHAGPVSHLDTGASGAGLPTWSTAVPPVPRKPEYTCGELLRHSDRAFVETAYMAVLRRPADADGLKACLQQLRSGSMSKIDILAELRWSAEGRARGVHVDGLLVPAKLHQWRRKRIVGRLIRWAHAVFRLPDLAERAAYSEAIQASEVQELGRLLNRLSAQIGDRLSLGESAQAAVSDKLVALQTNIAAYQAESSIHAAILGRITREEELHKENSRALDPMYVAFEERFRGSRDLIRERALPYLDIIRNAEAGTLEAPVLDVGCGRGDWLDILREHGLIARGVDSNRVFLDICRGRGLEVLEGDAVEVLRGLDAGSVGAITGMHIAEHLPFEVLVALLDEAKRVLRVGGVLALETPNPENLWVASHWFYMDPTHRNPLPPEALKWMAEARGFAEVRIERWSLARDVGAPPLLDPETPGAASINVMLQQLHAAPDYAIVATRIQ